MRQILSVLVSTLVLIGFTIRESEVSDTSLRIVSSENTIVVFNQNVKKPILVQQADPDFRPYIHPIAAPDGIGQLTEYSPSHHKHQTGLYWGLTRVNGRDYFHNPGNGYWKRKSFQILEGNEKTGSPVVKWQTVYNLLDQNGAPLLTETQTWRIRRIKDDYVMELEWQGQAQEEVTIGKYDYGSLFLRMPWKEGVNAEIINSTRQKNGAAEGQRSIWVDVGMQVPGRKDFAHVAVYDHPENRNFPQYWRVDNQFGLGPAPTRNGDLVIPKGKTETYKYQLLVYTGDFSEQKINNHIKSFTGLEPLSANARLWSVAQQEGKTARFLSPEEAVHAMTIKKGYQVNLWAGEPMVQQPMAFCWDDRGRLWVAENLDYESRGRGFSNDGNSRIVILEDTDRDGVADKRTVFIEGIPFPAALAVGFDGVFVGAPPNLLFIPDRNQDDKADKDAMEVRLTGWGIRDRHETLNSFHWGPDGWLYGLQGFATPSKIRKPVGKGKIFQPGEPFPDDILNADGVDINGGVWRYHPTKDIFEVVAHGFSNPWGIDYDANGQLFITACVIPHLWHVVPGGVYHRQGGQHFNPYVYNDIKTIADHSHRSAHGGARIYQSDAFPADQQGRIFMANIHEHAVLSDVLERKGSGFVGRHGEEFMMANNAQFVGFSMESGPDGSLYVLDWHDADICGSDVLNKETGRIFRIAPSQSLAQNWNGRYDDLNKLSDEKLIDLQSNKSDWHARRARGILQKRAVSGKLDKITHSKLWNILQTSTDQSLRLRALWSLHITNGWQTNQLLPLLNDTNEYIQAWTIQLLCEDKSVSADVLSKLSQMSKTNSSPVVRLYLASALQRLDLKDRWTIARNLTAFAADSADHNLPKMLWFAIEPLVATNPAEAISLASTSRLPLVTRHLARRLVDADQLTPLISLIEKQPQNTLHLLEGLNEGLEGRYETAAPVNWSATAAKLVQSKNPVIRNLTTTASQYFGDRQAAINQLKTVQNRKLPLKDRQLALQSLANRQRKELPVLFPELLKQEGIRIDVIKAIAAYDDPALGKQLLDLYPTLSKSEKLQAVQTLSSRPRYGWALTQALKNKTIPKTDVPQYAARQLVRVVGSGFVEVWGPVEQSETEAKDFARYRRLLSEDALKQANPQKGKVLFAQTCGPCHKLYGQGGNLGPDLTGSNRRNIDYLLNNVLDPSGDIQDDYKMVVITTRDGRTYAGNIVAENGKQVTLRTVGKEAEIINKSAIQSREATSVSMMPPGLFNSLTDTEVQNLVGYLRTLEDVKK